MEAQAHRQVYEWRLCTCQWMVMMVMMKVMAMAVVVAVGVGIDRPDASSSLLALNQWCPDA